MSKPLTPFENALAGALGADPSVKTRIQADRNTADDGKVKKQLGIVETLISIIKSKEGPVALYRGFAANMANSFIQQFAYFYWYTLVRSLYIRRILQSKELAPALSTATELILGALSAALAQLFTTPVGVVATRQQIGSGENSGEDETVAGHVKDIYEKDGITGFWRGLKPSLVLTVNPAITYGVFERIKNIILAASDGKMTPGKSFLVGALSKTLATIVTFPYILSKIRLQAKNTPYKSAFEVLGGIFKEKGILGWYQGMQAQITKAVLSQALLFYFRDYFEIWTRQLLALSGKK
ncbi:uncharacterized protein MJAP1_001725 [Malassezia japonica]|uniref:Uncharacterized protein n=1 Tax=Malassezia japonica TaxID=223818 RepID=A0AAF0JFA3_9BASI|nr:uncharacterized protein MJAP1_001725 [Malassezia japonica]WFD38761.1 hypothetical protein MJAP1_001725 [Malassezia japonica]